MLSLGISSWFGFDLPFEKRLKLISDTGFTVTFLWFGEEESMVRDGHADRMPALVRERGLALDNVHAPFRNCNLLWSESRKDRTTASKDIKATLLFCAKHRIPNVVAHVTVGVNPLPLNEKGIEMIRDLVSIAEDNGVTIALENTRYPGYLEHIFTTIRSPNLGFCYDSSHDFLWGQSKGAILKKWGHLLKTTHISDAKGDRDDHLQPGEGTIDWPKITEAFPSQSYQGALLLEIEKHADNTMPESYLQTAYKELTRIAKMIEKRR